MSHRKISAALNAEHTPAMIEERLEQDAANSDLGDALLGAIDGAVTTFAVVTGAMGGQLPLSVAILMGFANLLADGFSMGASNYERAKSEHDRVAQLRAQEHRHIELIPEGEREEIRQIFAKKGFEGALLEQIVETITQDREQWVDTMLREELKVNPEPPSPLRAALVTFAAFVVVGMTPLIPLLLPIAQTSLRFGLSLGLTLGLFVVIGAFKGKVLGLPILKSAASTFAIGAGAALIAWGLGRLISMLTGISAA